METLSPYEDYSKYSPLGRSFTGNTYADFAINSLVGRNYMPQPDNEQGMYDAVIQKERSKHFMNIQRSTFGDNALFSRFGMDPKSSGMKMMGSLMGSPDSAGARLLSPLIGGNPMAAGMHLYASMAGGNAMGNFGRLGGIDEDETLEAMTNASKHFYKTKKYEGPGGMREDIQRGVKTHLQTQLDNNTPESLGYLKDLGFKVDRDKKGNLTDSGKQDLQKQIDSYDLTREGPSAQAQKNVSNMKLDVSSKVRDMLKESDEDLKKTLNDRLEEQLKAFRVGTEEEIKKAQGAGGLLDPGKVADLFNKYSSDGPAQNSPESEQARQNIVGRVNQGIMDARTGKGATANRVEIEKHYRKLFEAKNDGEGLSSAMADMENSMRRMGVGESVIKNLRDSKGNVDVDRVRKQLDVLDTNADKDAKKTAKKDLEKVLLDNGVVKNAQELSQLKGKDGFVDPEKAQQKLAEFGVSLSEATENNEADKLKSQRYVKNKLAGDSRRALAALENARDRDDGNTEEVKKRNQDVIDKLKSKVAGKGYGLTQEQIEDRGLINKKGEVDIARVEKVVAQNAAPNYLEQKQALAESAKKIGIEYTGVDFEKSRGFKFDEMERAFSKASELRLIGDQKGKSVAGAMGGFFEKAGGSLSAARSLFGNKDAGALMQDISSMLGSEAVDMTSDDGNKKLEETLRKVKATARVAGVGINTMLQIIESTKEIAKNNPQLQYMNAGASTEIATKAVGVAAQMGRAMRPDEFRAAGGAQGLAAEDVKGTMAYMQSGMGQFQASMLAVAKTPEQRKQLEEMFKKGITAGDLDNGGMEKIAGILGMSVSDVQRAGNNPLLARKALKDADISKIVAEASDANIVAGFYEGLNNQTGIGSREDIIEKFKNFKGSVDEFSRQELIPNLTPEGQATWDKYEGKLQKDLVLSRMDPKQRAEYDEEVKRQTARDTEISKKMDAAFAPLTTQLTSAMAGGKNFESTAEAMIGVFATKDYMSADTKAAVEKARQAGGNLVTLGAGPDDDEMLLKDGKYAKEVNNVLQNQRKIAQDTLASDKSTAAEKAQAQKTLDTISTDELSGQEMLDMVNFAKDQGGTAEKNLQELERLEKKSKQPGGLKDEEREKLNKLKKLKGANMLSSEETYSQLKNGEGLRAVGTAAIQSQASANAQAVMQEVRANEEEKLKSDLKLHSADGGDSNISAALQNFGGDADKMLAAYKASKEKPGDKDNYFNQEGHEKAKEIVAGKVRDTEESIRKIQEVKQAEHNAASGQGSEIQVLGVLIKQFTEAIIGGGNIATSIGKLATALGA